MPPTDVKRTRESLVEMAAEAAATRDRLAALGAKISSACELVATVRSRGPERTTPTGTAQEPGEQGQT